MVIVCMLSLIILVGEIFYFCYRRKQMDKLANKRSFISVTEYKSETATEESESNQDLGISILTNPMEDSTRTSGLINRTIN